MGKKEAPQNVVEDGAQLEGCKLFGPNSKKVFIEQDVFGFIIKYAIHLLAASNIKILVQN
jgi:hypothetical protein